MYLLHNQQLFLQTVGTVILATSTLLTVLNSMHTEEYTFWHVAALPRSLLPTPFSCGSGRGVDDGGGTPHTHSPPGHRRSCRSEAPRHPLFGSPRRREHVCGFTALKEGDSYVQVRTRSMVGYSNRKC